MPTANSTPFVPVGTFKSFGWSGSKYQVGQLLRRLEDGDWIVEVTLLETGEKAEYRLTHLNADPKAI